MTTVKATFIGFDAVECPIPSIHVYLIRVSNNGKDTSEALLFLPYDSVCNTCDVLSAACVKQVSFYLFIKLYFDDNFSSPKPFC